MALLEIKAPSRYIEVRRPDGSLLSRHITIEDAIESAANAFPGVEYTVIPPRRTVKVYGVLPDQGVLPAVPTGLGADAVTGGYVDLVCDDLGDTTQWTWYLDGAPVGTTASPGVRAVILPSGVHPAAYSAQVQASNAAGSSALSAALSVPTVANSAPTWTLGNQAGVIGQAFSVNLNDFCEDSDDHALSFSLISGSVPGVALSAAVYSGTPTTFGSSSLTFRANDGYANSDVVISFTVADPDVTAPAAPVVGQATANGSTVTLPFTAGTDASGILNHEVWRSSDGTNFSLRATITAASPYVDSGVVNGTWSYKMKARDASGNQNVSAFSNTTSVVVNVAAPAPDVPINFVVGAVSSSQINLSWAPGPNGPAPTDYDIDFSTAGANGPWTALTVGLQTTFQHSGLLASQQYWYRLLAKNGATPAVGYATGSDTTDAGGGTPTFAFNNGFENYATGFTFNGPDPALYGYSVNGAGVIQVLTTHAREGAKSLRIAITNAAAGNYRQELRTKDTLEGDPINSISDYWLGLSIYVPSTAATNIISVAFQWHTTDNPQVGFSPSIGIRLGPNGWRMTRELNGGNPPSIELGQVVKNEWTDFVMRVVHRTTATGLIQLWMNEDVNPRVDLANIQTIASAQTVVPYFKFGIYQSQGNIVTERFYDALRISTNGDRNSMKPQGNRLLAP